MNRPVLGSLAGAVLATGAVSVFLMNRPVFGSLAGIVLAIGAESVFLMNRPVLGSRAGIPLDFCGTGGAGTSTAPLPLGGVGALPVFTNRPVFGSRTGAGLLVTWENPIAARAKTANILTRSFLFMIVNLHSDW